MFKILNHQQIDQVLENSHSLWGTDLSLENRRKVFHFNCHKSQGALTMVGLTDSKGTTLASLKRYHLKFLDPKQTCHPILGIGAVFTHTEYRNKGLAFELLSQVLNSAQLDGFHAAFLFSNIPPRYYEKLGFQVLPAFDYQLINTSRNNKEKAFFWRKVLPSEHHLLNQWWNTSWSDRAWWRIQREEPMTSILRSFHPDLTDYWLLNEAHEICGYFSLKHNKDETCLIDWAAAPNQEEGWVTKATATLWEILPDHTQISASLRSNEVKLLPLTFKPRSKEIPMLHRLNPNFDWTLSDEKFTYFSILDQF